MSSTLAFRDLDEAYDFLANLHGPLAELPETPKEMDLRYAQIARRLDERAIAQMVALLRSLPRNYIVRDDIALIFEQMATQNQEPFGRALLACLDARGPAIAVVALGHTGLASFSRPLLELISRHSPDEELRMALASALELLGGEDALDELRAWHKNGDPSEDVAAEVARILARH